MRRRHWFEFEDLPWVPNFMRDAITAYLQLVAHKMDFYKGIAPKLHQAFEQSRSRAFLDLASGGGGPWLKMSEHLHALGSRFELTLSDYYPNTARLQALVATGGPHFNYLSESIDAGRVPAQYAGFRTMFLSFHHFRPEQARAILQDAVDRHQGIAVFEAQERKPGTLLQFALSPLFLFVALPWLRPSFKQILFTYGLPVIPLMLGWDGCVSVLRTYMPDELSQMVQSLNQSESFRWEIGTDRSGPVPIVYLFGVPHQTVTSAASGPG